jgi:uncharacterized surface protein with fasciclin (FAS1) repeats
MQRLLSLSAAVVLAAGTLAAQCNATAQSEKADFGNATASAENWIAPVGDMDLVDLAVSVDDLSTLVTAVKAAGLVETLKGEGPFTVFAPTNKAFAELPQGTLEMLLKPENKEKLVAVLTYHVVAGSYPAAKVKDGMAPKTVEGSTIEIHVHDGGVKVNKSRVVKADVMASNGVVHVIDKVMLPPSMR